MKGLKKCFLFFSALICSVFVCLLVTSYPVNALELGSTGKIEWRRGSDSDSSFLQVYFNSVDGTRKYFSTGVVDNTTAPRWTLTNWPSGGTVNYLSLTPSTTAPTSPFLFNFTIRYSLINNNSNYFYRLLGFTGLNFTLLNETCFQNVSTVRSDITPNLDLTNDTVCRYTGYYGGSDFERILITSPIVYSQSNGIELSISPMNYITINNSSSGGSGGLSQSDITFLSQNFQWLSDGQSDNVRVLNQIKALLQAFPTAESQAQATADAVQEVLEEQKNQERQELQDATDSAQDSVDSAQDSVDSASSTLINQVSNFVNGLRQIQPSNCIIPFDLFSTSMYGRGSSAQSYNIDLCSLNRPPSFDVIDKILLVVWYIGATIMVLHAIMSLFNSILGGDDEGDDE